MLSSWRALFDGDCDLCERPIMEGVSDVVRLPEEDGGTVVHAQCAEDEGYEVD